MINTKGYKSNYHHHPVEKNWISTIRPSSDLHIAILLFQFHEVIISEAKVMDSSFFQYSKLLIVSEGSLSSEEK